MFRLKRVNSKNKDFVELVAHLDKELAVLDGKEHDFYNQFNKIDLLNHVVIAYHSKLAVSCGAFREMDEGSVEIKRMYTLESYRGKGLATQVLMELESWASAEGYSQCVLETGFKQTAANALYLKSNYVRIPNYGPYVDVKNSLCYRKEISPVD